MPIKEPRLTNLQIQTSEDILYSLVDEVNAGTVNTVAGAVETGLNIKSKYDSDVDFYKRQKLTEMADNERALKELKKQQLTSDVFSALADNEERVAQASIGDMQSIDSQYNALRESTDLLSLQKQLQAIDSRSSQSLYYTKQMGAIDRQQILRDFLANNKDEGELIMGVASRFSKTSSLDTAINMALETAKKVDDEAAQIEKNIQQWGKDAGMDMTEYYSNPEAWYAKLPEATQRQAQVFVAEQNLAAMKRSDFYNEKAFKQQAAYIVPGIANGWTKEVEKALGGISIDEANRRLADGQEIKGAEWIQSADDLKQFMLTTAETYKINAQAQYGNEHVTPDTFQSILSPFDAYVSAVTSTIGTKQHADTAKNLLDISANREISSYKGAPELLALQKLGLDKTTSVGGQAIYKDRMQNFVSFLDNNKKAIEYDEPVNLGKNAADAGIPEEEQTAFVEDLGKKVVTSFTSPSFDMENPAEVSNVVDTLYAYASDANRITEAKGGSLQPEGHAQTWLKLAADPKFKTLYDTKLTEEQQSQVRPQLIKALKTELIYLAGNQANKEIKSILDTRLTGWNLSFARYNGGLGGPTVVDPAQPETIPSPFGRESDAIPNTVSNVERYVQVRRLISIQNVDGEIRFGLRPSDETGVRLDTTSTNVLKGIAEELNDKFGPRLNQFGTAADNVSPGSNGRQQLIDGINRSTRGYK